MLIPFSSSNQHIPCNRISVSDDEEVWLIAPAKKLLGEAQALETHKADLRKLELNSSWLILDIVENHLDSLKKEILTKNPTELSEDELNKLGKDESAFNLECELYVRELVQNFKIDHPLLKKYKLEIGNLYVSNRIFPYQVAVAVASLSNRFVNDNDVVVDESDGEKGTIPLSKVRKGDITVGLPNISASDLYLLSEPFILKIFEFTSNQHNQISWKTTKELKALSTPPIPEAKKIDKDASNEEKVEGKPVETSLVS